MNKANITNDVGLNKGRGNGTLIFGILTIITSFVSVGFLCGIIGLLYGFIELIKVKRSNQNDNRKIKVGIICCLLGIIISLIFSLACGKLLSS